ncbi:acylglycerol kinase, mitochondrial-like [Limulus polyphemus]|uniref:Acylglycerol kinase, mitochondrial n=1 Tax=Limulus polyphemus TaxID=6850 RepID=A0ABM1BE98_LIMPO|nr:acylglycerol kinase, mitochondrial-like [Limulus polyphemus]
MAKLLKVLKTLRNHWKKSTLAAVLLSYGTNYLHDKYRTTQLMRAYCEEARKYGEEPLPIGSKPRHITVILNPTSKDGKGKTLYEKYAAPILHLAGMKVSIIQTEQAGQARDLLEIMNNTDAVIIAGGDGSLHEAVTGLFRRPDADFVSTHLPLGIIPIGKSNSVARKLFTTSTTLEAERLAEAAMSVIKQVTKPMDVMRIEGERGRPVYAVSKLEFGAFRDTEETISKYWYFGPLKKRMAYIFSAIRKWPPASEIYLSYLSPCSGCSKCYVSAPPSVTPQHRRWWEVFLPRGPTKEAPPMKDYSNITNDNCGVWKEEEWLCLNLDIKTKNVESEELTEEAMTVNILPSDCSRTNFIHQGVSRQNEEISTPNTGCRKIHARVLQLTPSVQEGEERWYSVDNDNYEVQPVKVELLSKKLYMYCRQ